MEDTTTPDSLALALARHGMALPEPQLGRLGRYCELLWEWNERLNLTRHTTYDLFVTRDLVDAMQLSALVESGERVVDFGSGGGAPGLILAILRPDVRVELCECIGKKARVLEQFVADLGLSVPVHDCRIEQLLEATKKPVDVVIARAVGPLWKILRSVQPYWPVVGRLLVVKGPRWVEERGEARHRGYLRDIELRRAATYQPPGANWESVILWLQPKNSGD